MPLSPLVTTMMTFHACFCTSSQRPHVPEAYLCTAQDPTPLCFPSLLLYTRRER